MKLRVIALYGVAMTSCVCASMAQAQTPAPTPTVLDGGSILVYGLTDNAPPAAASMASVTPVFPTYTPQSIQTFDVNTPIATAPMQAYGTMGGNGAPDTSYGNGNFYVVGVDANAAVAPRPEAQAPILTVTDPVMPVVPQADGASIQQPVVTEPAPMASSVQSTPVSAPMPELTAATSDPQVSMPPVMPEPIYTPPATIPSMGDSCAINQSLVEKITLLEQEKEKLRMQTPVGGSPELQRIAQCAAEHTKIQGMEAEIAFLREENESLKRISAQRAMMPVIDTVPPVTDAEAAKP